MIDPLFLCPTPPPMHGARFARISGVANPATTFAQRIGRARVPKALLLDLGFPEPELHVHERLTAPRICSADKRSPRAQAGDQAVYLGIGAAQD
jgi:hypothetical protein